MDNDKINKQLKQYDCLIFVPPSLGLAAARRVAQEGAKVMICSRKQANVDEALEQLHKEGLTNIHGIQCHVSDEQQRQNLIDEVTRTQDCTGNDVFQFLSSKF